MADLLFLPSHSPVSQRPNTPGVSNDPREADFVETLHLEINDAC
jgi:hypothetical protein